MKIKPNPETIPFYTTLSPSEQRAAAISEAGRKVIVRAFRRGYPYFVCPTPGLHNAAQEAVLKKLRAGRFIAYDGAPTLTNKGIEEAK